MAALHSILMIMIIGYTSANLLLVVEIARHGARAPFLNYLKKSMGITIGDDWDIMSADLTDLGERQKYLLGLKRRKIYIEKYGFLNENFDPTEIYVESSDRNRTVMSAAAQLLGMYPLGTGRKLDNQDQINAAVPPFEVATEGIDDSEDNPINARYQPIPINVKHFYQGIIQGYEGETCNARSIILAKDLVHYNDIYGSLSYVQNLYQVINSKLGVNRTINDFEDLWYKI